MATASTVFEKLAQQSEWYGQRAHRNRARFVLLKGMQIVFAAAIPVVSVATLGDKQRWVTATLGALVGIFEGFIQLGQYQQNWLISGNPRSPEARGILVQRESRPVFRRAGCGRPLRQPLRCNHLRRKFQVALHPGEWRKTLGHHHPGGTPQKVCRYSTRTISSYQSSDVSGIPYPT